MSRAAYESLPGLGIAASHLVDQLSLQDIRHEACTDALNLVRPGS